MFCGKENRLVDAKANKQIFYYFKVLNSYTINTIKTCKEIQTYIILSDH